MLGQTGEGGRGWQADRAGRNSGRQESRRTDGVGSDAGDERADGQMGWPVVGGRQVGAASRRAACGRGGRRTRGRLVGASCCGRARAHAGTAHLLARDNMPFFFLQPCSSRGVGQTRRAGSGRAVGGQGGQEWRAAGGQTDGRTGLSVEGGRQADATDGQADRQMGWPAVDWWTRGQWAGASCGGWASGHAGVPHL